VQSIIVRRFVARNTHSDQYDRPKARIGRTK